MTFPGLSYRDCREEHPRSRGTPGPVTLHKRQFGWDVERHDAGAGLRAERGGRAGDEEAEGGLHLQVRPQSILCIRPALPSPGVGVRFSPRTGAHTTRVSLRPASSLPFPA